MGEETRAVDVADRILALLSTKDYEDPDESDIFKFSSQIRR